MYDVIVVGCRVAGAATAMLLARAGLRVLAVDRASFPSDTLSTHQLQVPGVARLKRWGVLDSLIAAGTPATRKVSFSFAGSIVRGRMPAVDGVDALYSPRRTILDNALVNAAGQAGVEVRQRFVVERLLFDGLRVTGVAGREKGGVPVTERASLIIGADGKHSLVAAAVAAKVKFERGALTAASYTYWDGIELGGGEMYGLDGAAVGAWPTNDRLAMVYVARPLATFKASHDERVADYTNTIDRCGDLGARARSSRMAERVRSTIDVPNHIRRSFGAGWALAGDAGAVMDPITGQGMADALRDAEFLAEAAVAGLGGSVPLEHALGRYERRRDAALRPMLRMTLRLAALRPVGAFEHALFEALATQPADADRFFAINSGAAAQGTLFNPASLVRLLGARRVAALLFGKRRARVGAVDSAPSTL